MRPTNRQWTLAGWWLFIASAGLFMFSAFRAGDMIGFPGGGTFTTANIAFLIPFYRASSGDENED